MNEYRPGYVVACLNASGFPRTSEGTFETLEEARAQAVSCAEVNLGFRFGIFKQFEVYQATVDVKKIS